VAHLRGGDEINAKQVIAVLQPLIGQTVSTLTDDGYRTMRVAEVRHLPPDERIDADEGNVILDAGTVDVEGRPEGIVFWARDVVAVEWEKRGAVLVGRGRPRRQIEILG
jgi:sensor histidine kinase regulating citrate/malate metabolism